MKRLPRVARNAGWSRLMNLDDVSLRGEEGEEMARRKTDFLEEQKSRELHPTLYSYFFPTKNADVPHLLFLLFFLRKKENRNSAHFVVLFAHFPTAPEVAQKWSCARRPLFSHARTRTHKEKTA